MAMSPFTLRDPGFTLVELLVVITILVVLLALLSPAMDQAIYQAQLAVCASRLGAIATSSNLYATDQQRSYPYRQAMDRSFATRWSRPNVVVDEGGPAPSLIGDVPYDDRPTLYPYFGQGLKVMHDPLTGGTVDFAVDDFSVFVDYMLWFGARFVGAGGGTGMYRLGSRLEWTDRGVKHAFTVLASDQDVQLPNSNGAQKAWSSHPDREDKLFFVQLTTRATWHVAHWERQTDERRGTLETNFAYADGSVRRWNDVTYNDDRMAQVPLHLYGDGVVNWSHLPGDQ